MQQHLKFVLEQFKECGNAYLIAETIIQITETIIQGAEIVIQGAETIIQGAENIIQTAETIIHGAETIIQAMEINIRDAKINIQDAETIITAHLIIQNILPDSKLFFITPSLSFIPSTLNKNIA